MSVKLRKTARERSKNIEYHFDFEAILQARGLEILTPDETSDEIEQGVALILGEQ